MFLWKVVGKAKGGKVERCRRKTNITKRFVMGEVDVRETWK